MKRMRWHLNALIFMVLVSAVLLAGIVKARRHIELRKRIAIYSSEERRLLGEYRLRSRMPYQCGFLPSPAESCRKAAVQRRRLIEQCEREIKLIW